jgi:hypothetical protein
MTKMGWRQDEMVIVANGGRSFGADRRLLTQFLKAFSINVGEDSPTIAQVNPGIVQAPVKGMSATRAILDAVISTIKSRS